MNEQIRELWDKAAKSTAAYPSGRNNSWETQVNFMEKFAELIVKECSNIACEYDAPKMSGPGIIIAGRIETHFGVEE